MGKSIIQADETRCFLCGRNANFEPLDWHHVYGGNNRKNSEKYGLKVLLHHYTCHIFGKESVHQNAEVRHALQSMVQKIAMRKYDWTLEQWISIFGKSYLKG